VHLGNAVNWTCRGLFYNQAPPGPQRPQTPGTLGMGFNGDHLRSKRKEDLGYLPDVGSDIERQITLSQESAVQFLQGSPLLDLRWVHDALIEMPRWPVDHRPAESVTQNGLDVHWHFVARIGEALGLCGLAGSPGKSTRRLVSLSISLAQGSLIAHNIRCASHASLGF
jgi:hypothetical protein